MHSGSRGISISILFPIFLLFLSVSVATAAAQATSSSPTLDVKTVDIAAKSLAWDPVYGQIYLTVPDTGSIQVLNPVTGGLGPSVPAANNPDLIAVSANSRYVYVGLDGSAAVQRFTLPNLTADIQIPLGNDGSNPQPNPYFASDLEASPVTDERVAILKRVRVPAESGGAWIYDNTTPRSGIVCGFVQLNCAGVTEEFSMLQWNADGSTIFGLSEILPEFIPIPVTSAGFGRPTDFFYNLITNTGAIHFDSATGYIFTDTGGMLDLNAGELVGMFPVPNGGWLVPDGALGTAFYLEGGALTGNVYTITSFDIQRRTKMASVTISNVVGAPTRFIRWGANGLAFTTSTSFFSAGSAVYVLSGSFVSSPPDVLPTITLDGTTPLYSAKNTVQPGEWISIYGANLAKSTATWTGNFPTQLGDTSVTIDGKAAYLWYVSPRQINLQVPDDANTGSVEVAVTTPAGSTTGKVSFASASPAFLLLDSEHVTGIITRSDGSGAYGDGTYDILGPTGKSLGYPTVAAKPGDSVELFAVGLGPTTSFVPAGEAFSGAAPTSNTVHILVNEISVVPSFAGLSSAGLYQINLTIPAGLGTGDVPISATVAGVSTQPNGVISLQ